MISALYFRCQEPENVPQTSSTERLCKISLVAFQVLLIIVGGALYFSGVGVVPTAILWLTSLAIELSVFAYDHQKQKSAITISQSITREYKPLILEEGLIREEKISNFIQGLEEIGLPAEGVQEGVSCFPLFDHLVGQKILTFASSEEVGLTLHVGNYTPPNTQVPFEYDNLLSGNDDLVDSFNCSLITEWLYIASGPQGQKSIESFLGIVDACQRPLLIVMTTNTVEKRKVPSKSSEATTTEEATPTEVCKRYWQYLKDKGKAPEQFGDFSVSCVEEGIKETNVMYRLFNLATNGSSKEVTQYHMRAWSTDKPLDNPALLYAYTSDCLKEIQNVGKTILVHDDTGTGRAGAFATCLILHAIHEASKKTNVSTVIDLDALIALLREDSEYGRKGLIDLPHYYETITQFATFLKNK